MLLAREKATMKTFVAELQRDPLGVAATLSVAGRTPRSLAPVTLRTASSPAEILAGRYSIDGARPRAGPHIFR